MDFFYIKSVCLILIYLFSTQKLFPSAQGSQDETTVDNSPPSTSEISEIQPEGADANNAAPNIRTTAYFLESSHLIGREREKSEIAELLNQSAQELQVISVWGMGGLGKTTLVRDFKSMFEINAYVTVMHPFNLEELLKRLVMQLHAESSKRMGATHLGVGSTRGSLFAMMGVEELITELARLLYGKRFLIILDDLSSTVAWDSIMQSFPRVIENACRIIVTTREENIARHCSSRQENVYKLKGLQYKDALELFIRKVLVQLFITIVCITFHY